MQTGSGLLTEVLGVGFQILNAKANKDDVQAVQMFGRSAVCLITLHKRNVCFY